MPGDRDDEICQKALELLSDLCSKGEVQNEHCQDFIYYFRDLARPRYSDSGEPSSIARRVRVNAHVTSLAARGPPADNCSLFGRRVNLQHVFNRNTKSV